MNANSLKQNFIVIKEICSWLLPFCKQNLLFIQPINSTQILGFILICFYFTTGHFHTTQTTTTTTSTFNGRLSGTTRVGRYQKKHSPAHTHPGQRTSFITFLNLQWSTASSLFSLRAWQSSRTTSFQVLSGLPLGLEPSTSYSMHFFTQSSSSFRSTCPYQRSLLPTAVKHAKQVLVSNNRKSGVLALCVSTSFLELPSIW